MLKRSVLIVGLAAVALVGCKRLVSRPVVLPRATPVPAAISTPQPVGLPPELDVPIDGTQTVSPPSQPPSALQSSYQPFTLAAYNEAKTAGRPILLYFYANWCPLCRPQEPVNVGVFGDAAISPLGIAAFRVNYNDDATDDDERALARQLGVNYQHTFITFNRDGTEIWRTTGTQNREQLTSRLQALR